PGTVHDGHFVDLARHDNPANAFALEAADGAIEASDARPIESLHQTHQLRRGLIFDADADYGNPKRASLLGETNREATAAGEQTDRVHGGSARIFESELLLDLPHVVPEFRQFFQGHEDALLFPLRRGGRAEHALAVRHVLGHT